MVGSRCLCVLSYEVGAHIRIAGVLRLQIQSVDLVDSANIGYRLARGPKKDKRSYRILILSVHLRYSTYQNIGAWERSPPAEPLLEYLKLVKCSPDLVAYQITSNPLKLSITRHASTTNGYARHCHAPIEIQRRRVPAGEARLMCVCLRLALCDWGI